MTTSIILISPGPLDGYPPVQYQARLLADAGHRVEVVTMPLRSDQLKTAFTHPNVVVNCIDGRVAYNGRLKRIVAFASAIWASRSRVDSHTTVEIAFDPIGMFYSDIVPNRPKQRIAHFHELLQDPKSFLERRLKRSIHAYDQVVVADVQRAIHTKEALNLRTTPTVIENYPLRAVRSFPKVQNESHTSFEVIYCGSLGYDQKLDTVIRSMPLWPNQSVLTLIGNDKTKNAKEFAALAHEHGVAHRVRFTGWLDTADAEARLAHADLAFAFLETKTEQWRTALGASNKRYQYMKAGLPQIGDHNPGVPELIEGNRVGLCVTEHSVEAIASIVQAYMHDPSRCALEGARAFELHQQQFNYECVFGRLLKAFSRD